MSVNVKSSTGRTVIANTSAPYQLPIADTDVLGGIKVGNNLTIDENGILSAEAATTDYDELDNKPSINSVELSGNKVTSDLGLQDTIPTYTTAEYEAIKDTIPVGTIFNISDDENTGAGNDGGGSYEILTTFAEIMANEEYGKLGDAMLFKLICERFPSLKYVGQDPIALIPAMTSNTTPNGICSASTIFGSAYEAYKAFDNNTTTVWCSRENVNNGWIMYQFASSVYIRHIHVLSSYGDGNRIKNYKIEASPNGSSWTTIAAGTLQNIDSDLEIDIDVPSMYLDDKYSYIRLTVDSYIYSTMCKELQVYGFYAQEQPISNPLVPKMTSNTCDIGSAFAHAEQTVGANNPAYYAFDQIDSTTWSSYPNRVPGYIGFHFNNPVVVNGLDIKSYLDKQRFASFVVQGSNDNNIWNDIYYGTQTEEDKLNHFNFYTNTTPYTYIRIYTDTLDSSLQGLCAYIIQFYGYNV